MRHPLIAALVIAFTAFAVPVQAQLELGVDGAVAIISSEERDDEIDFRLPIGALRLGIGASARTQFHLDASLYKQGPDRRVFFGPGLAFSFRDDYPTDGGLFLASGFGVAHDLGETYERRCPACTVTIVEYSETQFGAWGGIGWRIPLNDVSAVRLAADYTHWWGTDVFDSYDVFSLIFGLSLFP